MKPFTSRIAETQFQNLAGFWRALKGFFITLTIFMIAFSFLGAGYSSVRAPQNTFQEIWSVAEAASDSWGRLWGGHWDNIFMMCYEILIMTLIISWAFKFSKLSLAFASILLLSMIGFFATIFFAGNQKFDSYLERTKPYEKEIRINIWSKNEDYQNVKAQVHRSSGRPSQFADSVVRLTILQEVNLDKKTIFFQSDCYIDTSSQRHKSSCLDNTMTQWSFQYLPE